MMRRSPSRISKSSRKPRGREALKRSSNAVKKLDPMIFNGSGLIHAVSISQVALSSLNPSIPCTDGTGLPRSATYT
jgi:hypothetical protein